MPPLILIGLVAVLLWSFVSHRFERLGVAGPAALIVLGALTAAGNITEFGSAIDTETSEKIVEIVLAIILFVDATEVRGGGIFGGEGRMTLRLVLIALPLSLILAVVVGVLMIPESIVVILVVACIVMPTDFAPAARILRLAHVPPRVRQILNVESGYNDGLVSPLFGMSLAMSVAIAELIRATPANEDKIIDDGAVQFSNAFLTAVPATAVAIGVGVALGGLAGWGARAFLARGIANEGGVRFVMLLLPLITYGATTAVPAVHANGFVAAFVAGVAYRIARTRNIPDRAVPHAELMLVDEIGVVTTNFVWFILGGTMLLAFVRGIDWRVIVFALLALTVLRIVPVYLSLLGGSVGHRDKLLIGALGPRGTASIVFGLLAFNALPERTREADFVLDVMVVTVVGSVLLHGVIAPLVLRGMSRRGALAETPTG